MRSLRAFHPSALGTVLEDRIALSHLGFAPHLPHAVAAIRAHANHHVTTHARQANLTTTTPSDSNVGFTSGAALTTNTSAGASGNSSSTLTPPSSASSPAAELNGTNLTGSDLSAGLTGSNLTAGSDLTAGLTSANSPGGLNGTVTASLIGASVIIPAQDEFDFNAGFGANNQSGSF